jgi:hypothetical protein
MINDIIVNFDLTSKDKAVSYVPEKHSLTESASASELAETSRQPSDRSLADLNILYDTVRGFAVKSRRGLLNHDLMSYMSLRRDQCPPNVYRRLSSFPLMSVSFPKLCLH